MSVERDAFGDEPELTLNKDDVSAERITQLAVLFMNASGPITADEVKAKIYPDREKAAADKAFNRDRKDLAGCGIVIATTKDASGQAAYVVDKDASYADAGRLTARDALVLDLVCRPFASDPSFPNSDELAMALAKINGSFADADAIGRVGTARQDRRTKDLRDCLVSGHACHMTYEDAKGNWTERTVAPLGTFGLRGNAYFVAAPIEKGGEPDMDGVRTFNAARVAKTKVLKDVTYKIPADFYVDDYIKLPFQIGPTVGHAEFLVVEDREADVRHEARSGARIVRRDGRTVLLADYSDLRSLVTWSIALGLLPIAPQELCQAWKQTLLEVTSDGR